jgi:hypothetical protein
VSDSLNHFNSPFGATELDCALGASGKAFPTWAELTVGLSKVYPGVEGPTVADLVSAGWLEPCISDKQRLRKPPLCPSTKWVRLHAIPEELSKVADTSFSPGPLVSYYEGPITNTTPGAAVCVADLHKVITSPPRSLRERADAARAAYQRHGKCAEYKAKKCGLDYFTAGGTFTSRKDAAVLEPSGLLTLDFDELGSRVTEARAQLLADTALAPALALVFISPSGDGLKAVLAADPRHTRAENYNRLAQHLTHRYGWGPTLDKKTADISRACFLSYDPAAWLAPAYA